MNMVIFDSEGIKSDKSSSDIPINKKTTSEIFDFETSTQEKRQDFNS